MWNLFLLGSYQKFEDSKKLLEINFLGAFVAI
jgi:hypothetical protein